MRKRWMDWYMCQSIVSEEEFKKTPSKQDLYNWMVSALLLISPRDIVKAFIPSGISVSMRGDEDCLSANVCRLRNKSYEEDSVLIKADDPDPEEFYKNVYADEEDVKSYENCCYKDSGEDEEELVLDESLDSLLKMLTLREEETDERQHNDSDDEEILRRETKLVKLNPPYC